MQPRGEERALGDERPLNMRQHFSIKGTRVGRAPADSCFVPRSPRPRAPANEQPPRQPARAAAGRQPEQRASEPPAMQRLLLCVLLGWPAVASVVAQPGPQQQAQQQQAQQQAQQQQAQQQAQQQQEQQQAQQPQAQQPQAQQPQAQQPQAQQPQAQQQAQRQQRPLLQDSRPYVIAHRGASGPLPEHTLPAYEAAIASGADFVECDVVVTRDLQLICRHEPDLNTTTDAWHKFRDRAATYMIDGESVSGIFAADLTLAEVKTLRAKQRWPFRDHSHDGAFEVPTLQEFLQVADGADRAVGIYPETKHPSFHNALPAMRAANTTLEQLLVAALHARGYGAARFRSAAWRARPVLIQSFEASSLRRLAGLTHAPRVLLLGGWPGYTAPDSGLTHEEMVSDAHLADVATFAVGVGPWKDTLLQPQQQPQQAQARASGAGGGLVHPDVGREGSADAAGAPQRPVSTGLVARLHAAGLVVHPYTLRDEPQFVLPGCGADIACEFDFLFEHERVDGGFADWPGTLAAWLKRREGGMQLA